MLSQLAVTHFISLKIVRHFIRTGLHNGFFLFPLFFFFSQYTCNINRHINHLTLTCFLINFYFLIIKLVIMQLPEEGNAVIPYLT